MDSGHSTTRLPAHAVVGGEDESSIGNISALAVTSLLLGIFSPLSFMAPLLWAIPLFGAAVAIVAMRRIASSEGVLIGRKAAVIGLALSVASLCAAASRSVVSQQMLTAEARTTALQWFSMLEAGDVSGAFHVTVDSTRGPAPPPPPGTPAPEEPPRDPLADFRAHPLVEYLMSVGKGAQTQFDQDLDFAADSSGEVRVKEQFLV